MCIKIKLDKSSKCSQSVGVLGSNPDSSSVVSQSPININKRSSVKGSAGDDGKEERDFLSPFTFPSSPSHQCLIVSRNRSLTAYKIIRDDWGRVSGQIKLEPHPIERLYFNFPTYGHGFFDTTIPSPKIYLSGSIARQRYSALLFKLNETPFFFGDKYCCYVNLALTLTVSSWISRIKTIGGGC